MTVFRRAGLVDTPDDDTLPMVREPAEPAASATADMDCRREALALWW